MRSRGGRTIQVNPVDEEVRPAAASPRAVTDHPDRGRMEAIMDQKLFWARIKSERASAYWFAASIWGVGGLILGALLGGYMILQTYTGLTPTVRETLVQGQAIQAAQDSVNSRDPILSRENTTPNR